MNITLSEQELAEVRAIIARVIPQARVWVFGSRAYPHERPQADLDLAIDNGIALTTIQKMDLQEAFTESQLIFLVDLVDLYTVTASFKMVIEEHRIQICPA